MRKLWLWIVLGLTLAFGAQEIRVGTSNSYRPFAYIGEDGKPTGYDVEVLRALQEIDSRLQFAFDPQAWNALFLGLDSGKYAMLAYQINKTEEREKKYLFASLPYFYGTSELVVLEGSSVRGFDDLKGKKIGVGIGDSHAGFAEEYLKAHPELGIQLLYYKNSPPQIADIKNGRIDAIIDDPIAIVQTAKSLDVALKSTGVVLAKTPVYFVFGKKHAQARDRVSEALQKALDSGKLREISLRYFGVDKSQ